MSIFYSIMTCVAARCVKIQKLRGFIMDVITAIICRSFTPTLKSLIASLTCQRATATGFSYSHSNVLCGGGGGIPQLATCR